MRNPAATFLVTCGAVLLMHCLAPASEGTDERAVSDLLQLRNSDFAQFKARTAELKSSPGQSISVFLDVLRSGADENLRAGAASLLADIDAKSSIAALREGLRDPSPHVRGAVRYSLTRLGDIDLPGLLVDIRSSEDILRIRAAESLALIDPPSRQIVGALSELLQQKDPITKGSAAHSLAKIAMRRPGLVLPIVPKLSEGLDDRSSTVRAVSAFAIAVVAPHSEPVLRRLLRAGRYQDDSTRSQVERALSRMGYPKSMQGIPPPPETRGYDWIAYTLPVSFFGIISRPLFWGAVIGTILLLGALRRELLFSDTAIYLLIGILPWVFHPILLRVTGSTMGRSVGMHMSMQRIAFESPFWLPVLLPPFLVGLLRVRGWLSTLKGLVYVTLGAFSLLLFSMTGYLIGSRRAVFIIPLAIHVALFAPVVWASTVAGWAVSRIARKRNAVASLLLAAFLLPRAAFAGSSEVLAALGSPSFGPDEARSYAREKGADIVPGLIDALNSGDALLIERACTTLTYLGPSATPAIPALVHVLESVRNGNWILGSYATTALSSIGPASTQTLIQLARDSSERVRLYAIEGLADERQPTDAALAALIPLLADGNVAIRQRVVSSINHIAIGRRPAALVAVPYLLQALGDPALENDAARALGYIRPSNPEVTAALIRIAESNREPAAATAAQALGRIGSVESLAAEKEYRLRGLLNFRSIFQESAMAMMYTWPLFLALFLGLLVAECLVYKSKTRKFPGVGTVAKFVLADVGFLTILSFFLMLCSRARFL